MEQAVVTAFLRELNDQLVGESVLMRIGYATDKIQSTAGTVKAFCPIHKDTRFRSLIVADDKKNYKCTVKTCDGYAGGSLLDLYSKSQDMPPLEAAFELLGAFDLQVDPVFASKLGASLLRSAEADLAAGNLDSAELSVRRATRMMPDLETTRVLLAEILMKRGQTTEAAEEVVNIVSDMLGRQDYAAADALLAKATENLPDTEDLLALSIQSANEQSKTEDEIRLYRRLAGLREEMGRANDNIGVYQRLAELLPNDTSVILKLAETMESARIINEACAHFEKAADLLQAEGDNARAADLLEKLVGYRYGSSRVRDRLVELLITLGEYERAKPNIQVTIEDYLENSNIRAADSLAQRWLAIDPNCIATNKSLITIMTLMGREDELDAVRRKVAQLAEQAGDLQSAVEMLLAIKITHPEDVSVRRAYINVQRGLGKQDEVVAELCELATLQFSRNSTEAARTSLREAAELTSSPPLALIVADAFATHGMVAEAKDLLNNFATEADELYDHEQAILCFEALVKLDPESTESLYGLATNLWAMEREVEGLSVTRRAVPRLLAADQKPRASELVTIVTRCGIEIASEIAQEFFDYAIKSDNAAAASHFYDVVLRSAEVTGPDPIVAMARALIELDATNEQAYEDLANALDKLGRTDEAVTTRVQQITLLVSLDESQRAGELAERLAAEHADRNDLMKLHASLLEKAGRTDEARAVFLQYFRRQRASGSQEELAEEFERYVSINPDDKAARRELAEIYEQIARNVEATLHYEHMLLESSDDDETLSLLEKLAELNPTEPQRHFACARWHHEHTDFTAAKRCVHEGMNLFALPEQAAAACEALTFAHEIAPDDGDILEALFQAQRLVEPSDIVGKTAGKLTAMGRGHIAAMYYADLGRASINAHRYADAEEHIARWVELAGNDPEAHALLADAMLGQNRTQRAVESLQAAAAIHQNAGNPMQAAEMLKRCVAIDPESASLLQQLSQYQLDAGLRSDAVATLRDLADLQIASRAYPDASATLSRLVEFEEDPTPTLHRLATLVLEHEDFEHALPHFRRYLARVEQSSSPEGVTLAYETIIAHAGASPELRADLADYLTQAGQINAAKQQLITLAQTYRDELNDPVNAVKYFGKATATAASAEDGRIFEELATLHFTLKVPEFALEALRESARSYKQYDNKDGYTRVLRRLAEAPEATVEDLLELASALTGKKQTEERTKTLELALERAEALPTSALSQKLDAAHAMLANDPLSLRAAVLLVHNLNQTEAEAAALQSAQAMHEAMRFEDESALLAAGLQIVPDSLALAERRVELHRADGNTPLLVDALFDLANSLAETAEKDAFNETLDELATLPMNHVLSTKLAGLLATRGDADKAVALYLSAAEQLAEAGEFSAVSAALINAYEIDPAGVPAAVVAQLIRRTQAAPELRSIANLVLDGALANRSRTKAIVVSAALLEYLNHEATAELLRHVFEKVGAPFLASVSGAHAEWLTEHRSPEDTRSFLKQVTDIEAHSPDIWWLVAQVLRKLGDSADAASASKQAAKLFGRAGALTEQEACYREVIDDFPDDAEVLETLAYFYEREKRSEDAVASLQRLAALADANNDPATAAKWFARAVEQQPENLAHHEALCQRLIAAQSTTEATDALRALATAYEEQNQPDKARETYQQLLSVNATDLESLEKLVALNKAAHRLNDVLKFSHRLADLHAFDGDHARACRVLRELLADAPEDIVALHRLGEFAHEANLNDDEAFAYESLAALHIHQEHYSDAAASFAKLSTLQPESLMHLQNEAGAWLKAKEPTRASEVAKQLMERAQARGDHDAERAAMDFVLQVNPAAADVRIAYARQLLAAGQAERALTEAARAGADFEDAQDYEQAVSAQRVAAEAAPDSPAVQRRLAELCSAASKPKDAAQAYLSLAEIHVAAGDNDAAATAVQAAAACDSDNETVNLRALAVYRTLKQTPSIIAILTNLALSAIQEERLDDAETFVLEGLELDPTDPAMQQCYVDLLRRTGRTEQMEFQLRLQADRATKAGDLQAASEALAQMCESSPNVPSLQLELAAIYHTLGDVTKAFDHYTAGIAAHLEHGELDEARNAAEGILELDADNVSLRSRLAELFALHRVPEVAARYYTQCATSAAASGNAEAELTFLRQAVAARPRHADSLKQLAEAAGNAGLTDEQVQTLRKLEDVYMESRKFNDAIETLKHQISLNPRIAEPRERLIAIYERTGNKDKFAAALLEVIDVYISLGRIEECLQAYRQLTFLRPTDPGILARYIEMFVQVGNEQEILGEYLRLAELYVAAGSFIDATKTFEQVLAIDRKNTDVREKFVEFLIQTGQKGRAINEMTRIIQIVLERDNLDDAQRMLDKALALSPNDAILQLDSGRLMARRGNPSQAMETLRKAAEGLRAQYPEQAIEACRAMVSIDGNDTDAQELLVRMLLEIGDVTSAAVQAQDLAELYEAQGLPEMASKVQHAVAVASRIIDDSSPSRKLANKGGTSGSYRNEYAYHVTRGDKHARDGNVDKALEEYQKARAINDDSIVLIQKYIEQSLLILPENELVADYLLLADRHLAANNFKKAKNTYEQVLALDPHNNRAAEGKRLADTLHS